MILKFNDATELQIQSAEPVGQGLRVLVIGTTPEQLRILFSDKVKTKVMKVEERGQLIATYENYTEYDHTEEYSGQIYGIAMNQVGKSLEEQLQEKDEQIHNLTEELKNANAQITDLQLAIRSILENFVEAGYNVPKILIKGLEVADKVVNKDNISEGE